MLGDTIVAAATPFGYSGIALIRISGPDALVYAKRSIKLSEPIERRATSVNFYDKNGDVIDNLIITSFRGPRSYTGEDVVEFSCHGSPAIIEEIISTITSNGARIANPGEFTLRAFLNGKIDLLQAEAIASLIFSKSAENAKNQQKILSGHLSKKLNVVRKTIIDRLSFLEHQMDISDEDLDPEFLALLPASLKETQKALTVIAGSFSTGRLLNYGARVVITGPPNVGKSSLLNSLSGSNRAIVSDQPGTTRDLLDPELVLSGVPVRFIDTAGIRAGESPIEREGIARAKLSKKEADLVLYVTDDIKFKSTTKPKTPTLFILNKSDLHTNHDVDASVIHISCLNNSGLRSLLNQIKLQLKINQVSTQSTYLSTPRQHQAVTLCASYLHSAEKLLATGSTDLELLAFELRAGLDALDSLLGKTTPDEILNNIFGSLCVGK